MEIFAHKHTHTHRHIQRHRHILNTNCEMTKYEINIWNKLTDIHARLVQSFRFQSGTIVSTV